MLCINKPMIISPAVRPISKISNENIITNKIRIIPNILGSQ